MHSRIPIILLSFSIFTAISGCRTDNGEASPQMSKNMLKLRGYKITKPEFFRAIKTGDPAVINGFFHAGIDPDSINIEGLSALTYAIKYTDARTVRVVARKANVNKRDGLGNAPLHFAIVKRHSGAIDALLDAKADVNLTGRTTAVSNQTPLFIALLWYDTKLLKRLLDKGGNPNIADSDGAYPLSEACVRSGADLVTVRLLVEHGAKVNQSERTGASPLIYAAQNAGISAKTRVAIVRFLLANGADASYKDKNGKTAIDWAKELEHSETAEILESAEKD